MKKIFGIFSFCALSFSMAYSQDGGYSSENNTADNSANNYNNNDTYYSDNNSDDGNAAYNNNGDNQSYQSFHDQLSPYGNWINYPGYGNVWVPNQVPGDFSPYATAGHWVYTDYGWTWTSDYAWGGVAFHYGRWFRDDAYGWMWLPGYEWAPAWVSWGSYDNYYCWAPLAPFVNYSACYRPNPYCWNFVDRGHFCQHNLDNYLANRSFYAHGDFRNISAHINIINESHEYGNRTYFSGPRANEVEHAAGRRIETAHVNSNQFHQQNFGNHRDVQANHFANNNAQREPQFNRVNANVSHANNNVQYQRSFSRNQNIVSEFNRSNVQNQRPAQQQYAEPSRPIQPRQSYGAQQRNFQRGEPMQRQYAQPSNQSQVRQSYHAPQRSFQRNQPVSSQGERSFASAQRSSSNNSSQGGFGTHGRR